MAVCEVCGNEYDKAIEVPGRRDPARVFDSSECVVPALAPSRANCGRRVIGHGVDGGDIYCCAQLRPYLGGGGSAGPGLRRGGHAVPAEPDLPALPT